MLFIIRFIQMRALGWVFIFFLSVVAFVSIRLTLENKHKPAISIRENSLRQHLPDYTITGLRLWRTSTDGRTQSQLSADNLVHYRDDLSSIITNPVLTANTTAMSIHSIDKSAHQISTPQHLNIRNLIQAKQAILRNEGESIEFSGEVNITRTVPNLPSSVLKTEHIILFPDTNQLFSKTETSIIQGTDTIISKNGIRYAHNDAQLQLNGPIKAVLISKKSF
jgi:LPS export ABC transporter protein LptC